MTPIPGAPTSSTGNFRQDLAQGMLAYNIAMLQEGFSALEIAPVIEVDEFMSEIGKFPLDDLLRVEDTERAFGAAYKGAGMKLEDFDYKTVDQGWTTPLDERWLNAFRHKYGQIEQHMANISRFKVMLKHNKRVIDMVTDASVFTGSLAATSSVDWDDRESAKPIDDISAWKLSAALNGGVMPNALAMGMPDFENLINNQQVLSRISASGAGDKIKPSDVTKSMLAQALGLEHIIVDRMIKNDSGRNIAKSLSWQWPANKVQLFYRGPDASNPFSLNFANTIHWGKDGSSIGGVIEVEGDWDSRSRKVRCRMDTDEKVKYEELGFLGTTTG
jgi:hypothetical protein